MDRLMKKITQVGVVVRDLEKAIESFANDFGVTEWNRFNGNESFGDVLVNGKLGKLNVLGAITSEFDGFEIELVQPIGPGPFMDYLEEKGPGIHHFAFLPPDWDKDYKKIINRETASGRKIWQEAEMKEGKHGEKLHFAYVDRREDMGIIFEIYNEDR